jgi:hypothetical protein
MENVMDFYEFLSWKLVSKEAEKHEVPRTCSESLDSNGLCIARTHVGHFNVALEGGTTTNIMQTKSQ